MAFTIPSIEPDSVVAGDLWTWTRSLSDYPAPTWTLTYSLVKADVQITLTATASGADHLISIAKVTTATYSAGAYTWQAYVTSGSERYTVGSGQITVKPNLALQTQGYDARTFAEKRVQQLEAALAARDPAMAGYTMASGSGSRTVQYHTLDELRADLSHWRGVVHAERRKSDMDRGILRRPMGARL